MLTYYLLVPLFYLIARIPTGILYGFSYVLAFVLRAAVGYRRKVVFTNLRNSFPDKTEAEINAIANKSYRHLADRVVENIKCLVITRKEIDRRVHIKNPEVLNDGYKRGQSMILMVGHVGSWEFGGYKASIACKYLLFGIVSLVSNPYFNRLIQRTRAKMGMHLIPMEDSKAFFQQPLTKPSLGVFISDQSPSNPQRAYWTRFLNQDTGFFTGAERYAKQHNCAVVYPKIVEREQGYFDIELITITNTPRECAENEITEKFVRLLEQHLAEHPSDWLWSHKRWKHKKPVTLS